MLWRVPKLIHMLCADYTELLNIINQYRATVTFKSTMLAL